MPRKPKHKNFADLLQYYINLYYVIRGRNPGLKQNESKHIHKIEMLELQYWNELKKDYPDWDKEENRAQLKMEIDFLTQVYSNRKEKADQRQYLKKFKEKMGI